MDLLCPKCTEPFDLDEFHEVAEETGLTFNEVVRRFYREGCTALPGGQHGTIEPSPELERSQMLMEAAIEMMGDDVDGVAAFVEDMQ